MTQTEIDTKLAQSELANVYKSIQDEAREVIRTLNKRREERKNGPGKDSR